MTKIIFGIWLYSDLLKNSKDQQIRQLIQKNIFNVNQINNSVFFLFSNIILNVNSLFFVFKNK